jgi:hypothetical protein
VNLLPIRRARFVVTGSNGARVGTGPARDGSSVVNKLNRKNGTTFWDSQISGTSISSGFASGRLSIAVS